MTDAEAIALYGGFTEVVANPLSARELARMWRKGSQADRDAIVQMIDRLNWWDQLRWCDLHGTGEQMLVARTTDAERAKTLGASASLPIRLAGGERIPRITTPVRQLNDALWDELTGDAPVSEARLREIEDSYAEAAE